MLKTSVLKGIALALLLGSQTVLQAQDLPNSAGRDTSMALNPVIDFRGQILGTREGGAMLLRGEMSLKSAHPFFAERKFPYQGWCDPDSVHLPLDGDFGSLMSGLCYSPSRGYLYNRWLEPMQNPGDIALTTAMGGIGYDGQSSSFTLGPLFKLSGKALRGTVCSSDSAVNMVSTMGKIKLPIQPQDSKWQVELAGIWQENRAQMLLNSELLLRVNFQKLPTRAWEYLADKARVTAAVNQNIDWQDPTLLQSIAELKDPDPRKKPKRMAEFLETYSHADSYFPIGSCAHIDADLLLSGVNFWQDRELRSLWYAGEVGLVGIGNQEVGKMTNSNSKLEYRFGAAGATDTLRIYLEWDEVDWAYFEQYGEKLDAYSSDVDGFNAVLSHGNQSYTNLGEEKKDAYLVKFVRTYIWRIGREQ